MIYDIIKRVYKKDFKNMLIFNEKENMNVQVENISKKIMELSISKKSFNSFFLPSTNKK